MENLKIIREKKGRNQLNVAINVGVTQEMISSYESGKANPSVKTLINLAKYLETSTDYLLGLTNNPTPIKFMGDAKLTKEEQILLYKYNCLAVEDKQKLIGYMDALNIVRNK